METFRDLRELIRWLGRGQTLLADMFSKRKTVAIRYDDAVETLDGNEQTLQFLIHHGVIIQNADSLELDDAYQKFFENVLDINEDINVASVEQYVKTLVVRNFNDKPIFRYMLKNIFTLSKSWLMTFDITGSTRGHNMTNEMCSQWGVDLSVRRFFLQKRLQIALAANDIFHTRNQSWWMNVKDVSLYKDSDADTRRVMLTISYSFNPKKNRYKGKNADEKEMKRL